MIFFIEEETRVACNYLNAPVGIVSPGALTAQLRLPLVCFGLCAVVIIVANSLSTYANIIERFLLPTGEEKNFFKQRDFPGTVEAKDNFLSDRIVPEKNRKGDENDVFFF